MHHLYSRIIFQDNVSKTEVVLFKSSRNVTDVPLKLKLNGKRFYPTNSVKYLGINIDENLNWKQQISNIAIKLNRANGILSKLRHFIDRKTLKSIYHAIFEPHLYYSSLVWAQNSNSIKRLFVLQKKSLRIIYFLNHNAHTSPLFRELNILKLPDKITLENCFFINKYFNKCLPIIFKNWFILSSPFHTYNICWSNLGCIVVAPHNTKIYGRNSINISGVYACNYLQKLNENNLFYQISANKLKIIIKNLFLNSYI